MTESINAALAATDIAGVIHVTALQVVIDGEVFHHFESFQLQQSITAHHHFKLVLQHDLLPSAQDHTLEDVRRFLGSRISVTFKYKSVTGLSPEREFIGVITSAGFGSEHGSRGSIILTGSSPTVLLDGATHTQSFGGESPVSLNAIASEVIRQGIGDNRYDVNVKCTYTSNLPYSCQYNESHYNYLCRMAAAYGEWFFYDGTTLHFGKPSADNPVKLIYGKDTSSVQLQMNALHTGTQHYGYNSSGHQELTTGDTPPENLGEAAMYAIDAGKKIFKTPSLKAAPIRAITDKDVEATQKSETGATASEAFTLTGRTTVPFLYPGCLVEMNFRKPESSEVRHYSRLMIVSVSHSVDAKGNYSGIYHAIPSDTAFLPHPEYTMPQAQPQIATVISNANSQGRVQVKFAWQQGSDSTDFIRVATPDAGSSQSVDQNRGFVFIPEEGDQVMVNFVHGHPDRPFVQSAMFHGLNGAGGYESNHKKSIITRSGCHIVIDDTEGLGSIHLQDPSGNTWHMDGAGNISLNAPKNITMMAGENIIMTAGMNIIKNAGENISSNAVINVATNAGKHISSLAGENYSVMATNVAHEAIEDFTASATNVQKSAKKDVTVSAGENIHHNSDGEILNTSGSKSNNS